MMRQGAPRFRRPRILRLHNQDRAKWDHFSRIGGATFSAGAGGSAGLAPASRASASGRAGCGGVSCGRWPVVVGSDGAGGLVSAPGVDCNGDVACASRAGGGVKVSLAMAEVDMPDAAASAKAASTSCFRDTYVFAMGSPRFVCGNNDTRPARFPRPTVASPWC